MPQLPKLIIETRDGVVIGVHSSIELQYTVIVYDENSFAPIEVGGVNTADTVDINLSLAEIVPAHFKYDSVILNHTWLG